jgi:hypothetical protein
VRFCYRVGTARPKPTFKGASMVIRHIGVASLARMLGALYALWGLIFGVIFALVALAGAGYGAANDDPMSGWFSGLFGVGAIVFLPVFYGFLGAIGGALTAVMYNVVAGMVGGLSIETE